MVFLWFSYAFRLAMASPCPTPSVPRPPVPSKPPDGPGQRRPAAGVAQVHRGAGLDWIWLRENLTIITKLLSDNIYNYYLTTIIIIICQIWL